MLSKNWETLSCRLAVGVCVAVLVAACASGGGGNNPGGAGNNPGGGTNPPPATVPVPAAATSGGTPAPAQTAAAGATTPNFFQGSTSIPAGAKFPLLQSAIKVTSTGWSADTATNNGGATLIHTGYGAPSVALSVPSLSLSEKWASADATTLTNLVNAVPGTLALVATAFPYVAAGQWFYWDGTQGTLSEFVTGFQMANMPTTGTATYAGVNNVQGYALHKTDVAVLTGDASLTANFATQKVTGSLTNMTAIDTTAHSAQWNDVAISGSIASGSSSFSGTTSVTSTPSSGFAEKSGATGTVAGGFYGPGALNAAGVWNIGDGTTSAFGTFGANLAPYLVAAAAAASFGTAPVPIMLADTTTTLNTLPHTYLEFPVLLSALQVTPTGVKAVDVGSRASLTVQPLSGCNSGVPCQDYRLSVPSLNLNVEYGMQTSLSGTGSSKVTGPVPSSPSAGQTQTAGTFTLSTYGLNYAAFGVWTSTRGDFGTPSDMGAYTLGYLTPDAAVPTTGTATYTGTGTAYGVVVIPGGGSVNGARVSGDVSMDANFATGKISGALSNMRAGVDSMPIPGGTANTSTTTPWNSVSLSADIAAGKNAFSGTTAASSAPTGTYSLKSTATGTVTGAFYGPLANEVGAVWTLSNPDGSGAAIGTFGGTKR